MSFTNPKANQLHNIARLIAIISFHLLMGWVLVSGLAKKMIDKVEASIDATLIEEVIKVSKPVQKEIPKPKVYIAKAEVPQMNTNTESTIQATTLTPPPLTSDVGGKVAVPEIAPTRISAKLDVSGGCTKPVYPNDALQAGEQGTVSLSFLISERGQVEEGRVDVSSGYRNLDEAARKALSLCKFKPGTDDGRPVASYAKIKYVWRIN